MLISCRSRVLWWAIAELLCPSQPRTVVVMVVQGRAGESFIEFVWTAALATAVATATSCRVSDNARRGRSGRDADHDADSDVLRGYVGSCEYDADNDTDLGASVRGRVRRGLQAFFPAVARLVARPCPRITVMLLVFGFWFWVSRQQQKKRGTVLHSQVRILHGVAIAVPNEENFHASCEEIPGSCGEWYSRLLTRRGNTAHCSSSRLPSSRRSRWYQQQQRMVLRTCKRSRAPPAASGALRLYSNEFLA